MGAPFMWILKKKYDYWWKKYGLTGRLKLRFLTEIGRLHWNQAKKSPTSPGLVSHVANASLISQVIATASTIIIIIIIVIK